MHRHNVDIHDAAGIPAARLTVNYAKHALLQDIARWQKSTDSKIQEADPKIRKNTRYRLPAATSPT